MYLIFMAVLLKFLGLHQCFNIEDERDERLLLNYLGKWFLFLNPRTSTCTGMNGVKYFYRVVLIIKIILRKSPLCFYFIC